jgi:hypothetical protein
MNFNRRTQTRFRTILLLALAVVGTAARGDDEPKKSASEGRKLSHEETLRWVAEHHAWQLARKAKPIWARRIDASEVGREFQTADGIKEKAREGYWLCVGIAGEPWFQAHERLVAKYDEGEVGKHRFDFDDEAREYRRFRPKPSNRNWVAQVKGPGIAGFYVRPHYDPERPLYSPAGGYVVKDAVADQDPDHDARGDVWLVQKALFESTYEIIPKANSEPARPPK